LKEFGSISPQAGPAHSRPRARRVIDETAGLFASDAGNNLRRCFRQRMDGECGLQIVQERASALADLRGVGAIDAVVESLRLQLRLDIFNAPNEARITGRNATLNLVSPLDQTATNLPFDASGALIPSRSQPKNAGVGLANAYQSPRTLQAQIRFVF